MTDTLELLPCPFCGSPGKRVRVLTGENNISCTNHECPLWSVVVNRGYWNTRPELEAQPATPEPPTEDERDVYMLWEEGDEPPTAQSGFDEWLSLRFWPNAGKELLEYKLSDVKAAFKAGMEAAQPAEDLWGFMDKHKVYINKCGRLYQAGCNSPRKVVEGESPREAVMALRDKPEGE